MAYKFLFFLSFVLYSVLFLLSLRGEKRSSLFFRIGLVPPVIVNGLAFLSMTLKAGHLPSHFLFERFVQLGFGTGLFLLILSFVEDTRGFVKYVLLEIIILFTVCMFFPMELKLPVYRYSVPMAKLFFQLEAISFVLLLLASAYCLKYLIEKINLDENKAILVKGRIYLLIGFLVFLASQFFGSVWSLQGWGDYWVWGKMSFVGVLMWFYIMFVIHSRYVKGFGGTFEAGVGVSLFLMVIIYRMMWQP